MIQTGEGLFGRLSEKRRKKSNSKGEGALGSAAAGKKNLLGLGFCFVVIFWCFQN